MQLSRNHIIRARRTVEFANVVVVDMAKEKKIPRLRCGHSGY